jgi:4-carboxymuconolactone decarboxylase
MSNRNPHTDAYARGKALSEALNPGMEDVLAGRYDALVPGLSRTIVEVGGQFYAREGLDEKTRLLITIGALTAQGGQTRPQLKVNIESALNLGATEREIGEAIFQMALYGGFPAMINALNAAIEVFDARRAKAAE